MPDIGRRGSTTSVSEGDRFERTVANLERRDFVKYAGASGDFNPIHYDELYATAAGNPSVFAQGMLTAGIASTVVTDRFGVGAVRSFSTRFQARVFPGDIISVSATVSKLVAQVDPPQARLDIEGVIEEGEAVISGKAVVDLVAD